MADRDTLANRLKSLTDNTLEAFENTSNKDRIGIDQASNFTLSQVEPERLPNILKRNLLHSYLSHLSPKQKERNEKTAWICRTKFKNGSYCHTVNGTFKGGETIKKTCGKCKQWRNSPLSIYEELMQDVLKNLEQAGINTEGLLEL